MRGEVDILVGTQLLAKGHDLPRLALVGILMAENELQFPDYTSSERSYQLMHQLIGRVGRGHRAGEVVVQTYDPANIAVQTAVGNYTWQQFYEAQILERKQFGFPPFFYLMKIEVTRARQQTIASACDQIIKFLAESGEPVKVSGPTPSFIEKRNNTWTWQIIVKAKQRPALTRLAKTIPVKCIINLDPGNLL
jgi:primosomal protein N' (replication factor Y)